MPNFLARLSVLLFILSPMAHAQAQNEEATLKHPSVNVYKTTETIVLDGIFDEGIWQRITPTSGMNQNFPDDELLAAQDTEVSLAYDEENLYIAVTCHAQGNDFITTSLRRDYGFFGNDNVTILFDTYNDQTNAIVFGMNAYGLRREATVANAGQSGSDFDDSWDNKWQGVSKQFPKKWTAEMAIPFSTLRFKNGSKTWRFNMYRVDTQGNEISTFTDIPRNRFVMDIGYMGEMIWEEPLEQTGKNISLIPYVATNITRDFEDPTQQGSQRNFNFGGDAKIGISSGLNLDLTVNPDFSQVEVDQQVSNLDRFELLFPERRQFFLENADLFGSFGNSFNNPFFSRRIGVSIDPETGQNIQNTILYGARLSGKLNEKLRIGFLNMQTASIDGVAGTLGTPGYNFSVGTAEQRISKSSRVKFMGVNKQLINPGKFEPLALNEYNRLLGFEYQLNTPANKWVANASLQKSFTPNTGGNEYSHTAQVVYTKRKYRLEWAQIMVGSNYNPEVGFAPRKDFLLMSPEGEINFYPKEGKIASHSLGFDARFFYKLGKDGNPHITEFGIEEINVDPFWSVSFQNLAMLRIESSYKNLTLLQDFDPTRLQEDGVVLPAGTEYSYLEHSISFTSDLRKKLSTSTAVNFGTYFNGHRYGAQGSVTLRYQPYGFVSLNYSYNKISLDAPFKTADIWLIGPRIDLTFTKSIFLTTFVQYNNQLDNLNINARFQWRFAPVSDFFIVYTDNYDTGTLNNFGSRNRALIAKMTYWFNL